MMVDVTVLKKISMKCRKVKPMKILKNTIPLIGWLSAYKWKADLLGDIIAGITVAVMHIPQGTNVCKEAFLCLIQMRIINSL